MTDRTHGQLVPDATSPQKGGVVYLRDGGGSSPPPISQPLVYCHVVGNDKQNDIWSCAPTPAEAVAEGPTSYRTITPPNGCLKV